METLALAEQHGINTVSMHKSAAADQHPEKVRATGRQDSVDHLPDRQGRHGRLREAGGELVDAGCEAIYLWGVHADPLAAQGKIDLIARAVEVARELGVPSGVGCHDLNVVIECEKNKVPCDFYIKTFHHHKYPSGPKPEQ